MSGAKNFQAGTLLHLGGAITCGVAWLFPNTATCALLSWVAALLFVGAFHSAPRGAGYLISWFAGVLLNLIGFHWLFDTIAKFGGFPAIPAAIIFGLFIFISALQLPLALLFINLSARILPWVLAVPIGWVAAELSAVRIFPWYFGHTQLAFPWMAHLAADAGALGVTALLFFVSACAVAGTRQARLRAAAILVLVLLVGVGRDQQDLSARSDLNVRLVQGNLSLAEKHSAQLVAHNAARYQELSLADLEVQPKVDLILWPESAIMAWIPTTLRVARDFSLLPLPQFGESYLLGALSFASEQERYNSIFAIGGDGSVLPPYHKRILMPFGEYTPFAKTLPVLAELNANVVDFTAGGELSVFELKSLSGVSYRIAPLICYEDVISEQAVTVVRSGAQILASFSNDAWFGDGVASYQHHMIAAFRAIETGRYLLRATNSGYSAVVDPSGRSRADLAQAVTGALDSSIELRDQQTIYTVIGGGWFWWGTLLVAFLGAIKGLVARRRS